MEKPRADYGWLLSDDEGDHGVEYSPSFSPSKREKKYDVFLSFPGEDTRKSFTAHLYAALRHDGLTTFRADLSLEKGQDITASLHQAIEESFTAIVVLSENYASSRWCLEELLKILHSKEEFGLHIFPIFYRLDPTNGHQTGSFAEAFAWYEQNFTHDEVQRWRDALREVADISSWRSKCFR